MLRVEILGRLTKDPEVKFAQGSGKAVCKFTLAVNEGKDQSSFHDITTFGKTAELIGQHCKKGQMIFIDNATINNNKYDDKDGITRYTKDIIAFSFKFC